MSATLARAGVGLALDLQRALAQLGEEVVAGVGGDALADQVELRVELVEAGVLGQGGRRFQVDGRLRSRPGGPGLAAQAQEQAQGHGELAETYAGWRASSNPLSILTGSSSMDRRGHR